VNLNGLAKKLRKELTEAERKLWRHLRAKQIKGVKFRRQQLIGNYIADFYCAEKKLVIELDGGQHAESKKDKGRDTFIENKGIRVARIWNSEVMTNIEGVMEYIKESLEGRIDTCRYFKKKAEDKVVSRDQ